MGTRIRIGKGFTAGRSGLRWGHSLPWDHGYGSVGASGTLITGGPLRHWEPARGGTALPVATSRQERSRARGAVLLAVLAVTAIWGLFAFAGAAERDHAAAQETGAILKALGKAGPVDCATHPYAQMLYECTGTPVASFPE